ncbi:MAG: phage tail tape measure protein, partial [Candidatus Caldarchaeum sp.]
MPELGSYIVSVVLRAQEEISGPARKAAAALAEVEKSSGKLSGALSSIGKIATGVIGGLLGFSVFNTITDWVRGSIDAFMRFEAQTTKLAALSASAGESVSGLAQAFRVVASSAARELAVTGEEAATALESLVKAGLSGSDAMKALKSAIMLARLEGVDFATASNNLVQVMAQFGIEGRNAARVVDVLINASRLGIGTANDFAMGLANTGATARGLGLSLAETTSWLVVLERRFGSAQEAGTHLNRFLLDLGKIAENLGVPLRNVDGSMRNINDVILDVVNAARGLGGDFLALQSRLEGVDMRAMKTLFTLTQMTENFSELSVEIARNGVSWEAYKQMLETTSGKMAALRAENDRMQRMMGENASAIYTMVAPAFLWLGNAFTTAWRGIVGTVVGSNFDRYLAFVEAKVRSLGQASEEEAAQWIKSWVEVGHITVSEGLKIAEAVGLKVTPEIEELIQIAVQSGKEVPDAFKEMADEVTRSGGEIANQVKITSDAVASLASKFHLSGEKIAEIINKVTGLNVTFNEHEKIIHELVNQYGLTREQAEELVGALVRESEAAKKAAEAQREHEQAVKNAGNALNNALNTLMTFGQVTGPFSSSLNQATEALAKLREAGANIPASLTQALDTMRKLNEQFIELERKSRLVGAAQQVAGVGMSYFNTMASIQRALLVDEIQAQEQVVEAARQRYEALQQQYERMKNVEDASRQQLEALKAEMTLAKEELEAQQQRLEQLRQQTQLTDEQAASQERLTAIQSQLGLVSQIISMQQTAMQLAMMGATSASDMFMNATFSLITTLEDGVITEQEMKDILMQLGVQFDKTGGPVINLKAIMEEFRSKVAETQGQVEGFRSTLASLDGYTIHTYHYHHQITLSEGGGGASAGGSGFQGAPGDFWEYQRGAWYTPEGPAYLHRGEMVLPRPVAEWFRQTGGVTNNITVNVN